MDIGKTKNNFNKYGRPKCFNCNTYEHIAKDCRKPKKEQDARKCYKYEKIEHITRNCKSGQRMKNQSVQEEPDICCGNHLSQRQMITQMVNLLVGYQVGNS